MAALLTTDQFEGLLRGETGPKAVTVTEDGAAMDLSSAVITAELWSGPGRTGTLVWTKTIANSGISLPASPATDGYFILNMKTTDYDGQVEGDVYYLEVWVDKAGDDVHQFPVLDGKWWWKERGVTTP